VLVSALKDDDLMPKGQVLKDEGLARPEQGSGGAEYNGEHPRRMTDGVGSSSRPTRTSFGRDKFMEVSSFIESVWRSH
jgi:hypothetical protein